MRTERWRLRVHSLLQVGWRPDKGCWPWSSKGITCGSVFTRWEEHTHTHTHAISYTLEPCLHTLGSADLIPTRPDGDQTHYTHTYTISHHLQCSALAMLPTVALLLPFHIHVWQLPQMEFSAYLKKDSSKWHCPVADDYHVCNNKLRFLLLCFINILINTVHTYTHTHTVYFCLAETFLSTSLLCL